MKQSKVKAFLGTVHCPRCIERTVLSTRPSISFKRRPKIRHRKGMELMKA